MGSSVIIKINGGDPVEHLCPKCNEKLTPCIINGGDSFIAVKKNAKSFTENSSRLIPYVCPKCGYTEWYVEKPENFK